MTESMRLFDAVADQQNRDRPEPPSLSVRETLLIVLLAVVAVYCL